MANEYSTLWFSTFMANRDFIITEQEAAFIMQQIPLPKYKTVLDLCCGFGRHANLLAKNGYQVVGIDRDNNALREAEKSGSDNTRFIQYDMREISTLQFKFDAIISMWHSFGYFERSVNLDIIKQISEKLNTGGRFIIDVYNKAFMESHTGKRQIIKGDLSIAEQVSNNDGRFHVDLIYGSDGGKTDEFEWQLYTSDEMIQICSKNSFRCITACTDFNKQKPVCSKNSFRCITACTDFNKQKPVDETSPRMQLVFEKA